MPNIQKILNEEIRRLARREIRNELVNLKEQLALMRKTITEQNRRIKALEDVVPAPAKPVRSPVNPSTAAKPVRVTAGRIKKLRMELCLSQRKFAILLGVNPNSVYYWESGKIEPKETQKRKIAAIRDAGKRELAKLMAEKNIVIKLKAPGKPGETVNEQKDSGRENSRSPSVNRVFPHVFPVRWRNYANRSCRNT